MSGALNRARSRALKIKFKALIVAVGGIEEAERLCRVGKSTLARYYSLHDEHADMFAPIDVVRDLEEVAGDPIVTRYLAQEANQLLIAAKPLTGVTIGNLHTAIADCAREGTEATASLLIALADGKVCERDAETTEREIDDAIAKLMTLRAMVRATQGEIDP
jgi:hypothetical protein